MKTKLLFLVLVIFVAFGCKTTKQATKMNTEVKTELNADVKTSAETKAAVEIKTVATDKGVTATSTNTKVTETQFSEPDANGKQHPTSQKVTEQTTNTNKAADAKIETQAKSENETKAKTVDKSDFKSDVTSKAEDKKTNETETPGFITGLAYLLGFAGIGLIVYLLKRFGVIK